MNEFKIGDTVKCIDGVDFKYYKGDSFRPYTGCTMIIKEISENCRYINGWSIDRFELVINDWDD